MTKDSDSLGTIDGSASGGTSIETALGLALEEVAALSDVEATRSGFDRALLPAFADRVRTLLDAGDRERAARVVCAALSLILRAHARELLHSASATATHRAAVDRIGAAMSALAGEHGQRALTGKVGDDDLPGLRPRRRRWRLGSRRG